MQTCVPLQTWQALPPKPHAATEGEVMHAPLEQQPMQVAAEHPDGVPSSFQGK